VHACVGSKPVRGDGLKLVSCGVNRRGAAPVAGWAMISELGYGNGGVLLQTAG